MTPDRPDGHGTQSASQATCFAALVTLAPLDPSASRGAACGYPTRGIRAGCWCSSATKTRARRRCDGREEVADHGHREGQDVVCHARAKLTTFARSARARSGRRAGGDDDKEARVRGDADASAVGDCGRGWAGGAGVREGASLDARGSADRGGESGGSTNASGPEKRRVTDEAWYSRTVTRTASRAPTGARGAAL